jgi:predicted DNA binding protein
VISALFLLDLPTDSWIAEVSQSFPNATLRLLAGIRTGDRATELGEVRARDPATVGRAIRAHPAITRYERLELTEDRLLGKYETTETGLYTFLEEVGFPPEFPATVRDGRYELPLTGSTEEFDRLRRRLEENDHRYELLSKTTTDDPEELLTARQREVLSAALRAGYLDVPRRCTLAELADRLDADKSTVSGVLRRAHARLAGWFLTGEPDAGRR